MRRDERHVHRLLGVPHVGREARPAARRARNVTANTTSAPQNSRRRTGSSAAARAAAAPPALRAARRGRRSERSRSADQQAAIASSTSTPTISGSAVRRDVQRRRHPHQPGRPAAARAPWRTPARRPAAARARARRAARPAGPPPRSAGRARAQRACGRGGYLGRAHVALRADRRPSRSRIEGYALEGLARTVSSGFERDTTVIALRGRRRGGPRRGRHLRGRGPRRPAAGRARCSTSPASGRSTRSPSTSAGSTSFPGFTPEQDGLPPLPALGASSPRRWTSRCARPARSLHELLGRDGGAGHVRRLLAHGRPADARRRSRGGSPRYPTCASSSTRRPDWTDELIARLQETGAVDSIDFKGAYKGTVVDTPTDPAFYRHDRRGVPGRLARGPRPRDRRGRATRSRPHQDRITWDAPIHSTSPTSSPRR